MSWFNLLKQEFIFFNPTPSKNTSVCVPLIALFFIQLELQIRNQDSSFYSSYMIFWRETTLLHRQTMYIPLFKCLVWIGCRMAKALWFRLSAEIQTRVRLPFCITSCCGVECKAQRSFVSSENSLITLPLISIFF